MSEVTSRKASVRCSKFWNFPQLLTVLSMLQSLYAQRFSLAISGLFTYTHASSCCCRYTAFDDEELAADSL